jgi:L-rhamnose isomerase
MADGSIDSQVGARICSGLGIMRACLETQKLGDSKPAWTRSPTGLLARGQTLRARGPAPMKLTSVERELAKLEAAVDALPSQHKRVLSAIVDDTDDEAVVKEKMEKTLAEHVAHPEDTGLTVQDFDWILRVIVRPAAQGVNS